MKRTTLFKSLLLTACLIGSTIGYAEDSDVVTPVFEVIENPVPDFSNPDWPEGTGQFVHIKYSHAAWGDFNDDGYLDVFYAGRNDHYSYWEELNVFAKNLQNETFEYVFTPAQITPIRSGYFSCPVWFDFNNDGHLDLLVAGAKWDKGGDGIDNANYFTRLYQNMGPNDDGEYTFEEVPDAGGIRKFSNEEGSKSHQYISVGDYDNDGWIDVVVTGFGIESAYEDLKDPIYDDDGNIVGWEDNDEDKKTERMVRLYKNNEGKGFIEQELPIYGISPFIGATGGSVFFMDMDNDGWLDIVSSGYSTNFKGELNIYWNNGDGTFAKSDEELKGSYNSGSGLFDMDNDGFMDILVSGFASLEPDEAGGDDEDYDGGTRKNLFIYKNNGDRTFTLITKDKLGFEGIDGGNMDFGDVNHDGLTDIFIGGHSDDDGHEITSFLYLNKGDGTFEKVLNPVTRSSHGSQNLIDFNNDGRLDAFVAGWGADGDGCTGSLWKNTDVITANEAPSVPENLKASYDMQDEIATFTWDASTDDVTPSDGLFYNLYLRKQGSDEIFMTVPADINTGFIKVGDISGQIMTTSYSMYIELDMEAVYEWGVQAFDNGKMGSQFATGTLKLDRTNLVTPELENVKVYTEAGKIKYEVDGPATIRVTDLNGKVLVNKTVSASGEVTNLTKGYYIVTVNTKSGVKNIPVIL